MIEFFAEPFSYTFMRYALYAGLLTVVVSSLVGTWIVMRGMAFMGDALAHGVLPGIAIAYITGGSLLLGAAASSGVMILGISFASARGRLGEDTAIGLLFVGMLAAGVAIISVGGAYAGDLTTILFGEPLGIGPSDLRTLLIAAAITVVLSVALYRPFLVLSFSRAKAQLLGLRPALTHLAMLALIALVVVSSFRTVGTLLILALLVAPPATASLLSRRVPIMMIVAMLLGMICVVLGLLASYHLGTAGGATIAGMSVLLFFIVLSVKEIAQMFRRIQARRARASV